MELSAREKRRIAEVNDLLDRLSKRCPQCKSTRISSDNSTPLNHACLACGKKFKDNEALPAAK
jgi:uncharacterized protein (DUF983 family)